VDLAKYRTLFLEEATEHLAEIGQALITLEKDPQDGAAIDIVFRSRCSVPWGPTGSPPWPTTPPW
jgi:chemotaxis protein histidine kinase CheA